MSDAPILPMSEVVTSYYLRLRVADQAGVLAEVTGMLADAGISHRRDAAARSPARAARARRRPT